MLRSAEAYDLPSQRYEYIFSTSKYLNVIVAIYIHSYRIWNVKYRYILQTLMRTKQNNLKNYLFNYLIYNLLWSESNLNKLLQQQLEKSLKTLMTSSTWKQNFLCNNYTYKF